MKNRLHILVIPYSYKYREKPISGIFFREQALALRKAGHKVGVIALRINSIRKIFKSKTHFFKIITYENDEGIETFQWEGWNWLTQKIPSGESHIYKTKGRKLFRKYIKKNGLPDIIHAHAAVNAGILARDINRHYDIPYVLTEHRSAYARGLVSRQLLRIARGVFKDACRRIVVSPELGRTLENALGETVKPWEWIPNLVSERFFNENIADREGQEFVYLNIAVLTPKKGQKNLISAFASAFKGNTSVSLRIGGDGPLRDELEEQAEVNGISRQVHFLGMLSRDEVLREMQQCNVFVLSSHYETFGIVLTEALACGKPVIATKCGGPECIVKDENGLLVNSGDVDALKEAMVAMHRDYSSYDSEHIRTDCRQRFSEEAIILKLQKIYEDVCGVRLNLTGGLV